MSLLEDEIAKSLTWVEYTFEGGVYKLDAQNLKWLVENVVLGAIYNADLMREVYTDNN